MKKFMFWNCLSLAYGIAIGFGVNAILYASSGQSLWRLFNVLTNVFFIFVPFFIFILLLINRARSIK